MSEMVSRRHLLMGGLTAVGGGMVAGSLSAADEVPRGGVTLEQLGTILDKLGLKPEKTESRFDFAFAANHGEEWELSMSVVLSNDIKTLWVMAWLDELPQSSADVPRTALLRLLADNDKMGSGQFFAYVATNRRFVLQRVVANENITPIIMREMLVELGKTVANTYPHWAVINWKQLSAPAGGTDGQPGPAADANDKGSASKSTGTTGVPTRPSGQSVGPTTAAPTARPATTGAAPAATNTRTIPIKR